MKIDVGLPGRIDLSAILKPFLSFRLVRNLSLGFPTEQEGFQTSWNDKMGKVAEQEGFQTDPRQGGDKSWNDKMGKVAAGFPPRRIAWGDSLRV